MLAHRQSFIMHRSWLIVFRIISCYVEGKTYLINIKFLLLSSELKVVWIDQVLQLTDCLNWNSSFYYSNRQTQHRHLPPLPRKVLSTQLATRLSVAAGCCRWGGVGCCYPVTSPFVPHIPRGLPATGWGPIESGPATIRVCLQEMPHQILQVPQHPDEVSAEGQPPASREREP